MGNTTKKFVKLNMELDIPEDLADKLEAYIRGVICEKNAAADPDHIKFSRSKSSIKPRKVKNLVAVSAWDFKEGQIIRIKKALVDKVPKFVSEEFTMDVYNGLNKEIRFDPYIVDMNSEESRKEVAKLIDDSSRSWRIYELHMTGRRGSDYIEVVFGNKKPESFKIRFIQENVAKTFDMFIYSRFSLSLEEFTPQKRDRYMKLFRKYIKLEKRTSQLTKILSTLVDMYKGWCNYIRIRDEGKLTPELERRFIDRENGVQLTGEEIESFMDILQDKLDPRDVYTTLDKHDIFTDQYSGDTNRKDILSYILPKFDLLTEEETVVMNDEDEKPYIRNIAKAILGIGKSFRKMSNKQYRLANDSWCNQMLFNILTKIDRVSSSYSDLPESERLKIMSLARLSLVRYSTIKEFPDNISFFYFRGELADDLKPIFLSAFENSGPRDRLALNSIINADPKLGGDKLLKEIPPEYPRLRKIIMEHKLKR